MQQVESIEATAPIDAGPAYEAAPIDVAATDEAAATFQPVQVDDTSDANQNDPNSIATDTCPKPDKNDAFSWQNLAFSVLVCWTPIWIHAYIDCLLSPTPLGLVEWIEIAGQVLLVCLVTLALNFLLPGYLIRSSKGFYKMMRTNGHTLLVCLVLLYMWILPLSTFSPKVMIRVWPNIAQLLLWASWLTGCLLNAVSLSFSDMWHGTTKHKVNQLPRLFLFNRLSPALWVFFLMGLVESALSLETIPVAFWIIVSMQCVYLLV
jgi:hypothetical protein